MKEIVFRRATEEDAGVWAAARQKAWAATYRGIYPDEWIDHYDYAGKEARDKENLRNPLRISYLVMDGESCAGYFSYGPTECGAFYLNNLYLLPGYQRLGLGTRIFALLRADCLRLGYDGFYCHCNYHNLPARRFYEKMGGRLAGDNGFHENKAEDQCRYEYTLRDL